MKWKINYFVAAASVAVVRKCIRVTQYPLLTAAEAADTGAFSTLTLAKV